MKRVFYSGTVVLYASVAGVEVMVKPGINPIPSDKLAARLVATGQCTYYEDPVPSSQSSTSSANTVDSTVVAKTEIEKKVQAKVEVVKTVKPELPDFVPMSKKQIEDWATGKYLGIVATMKKPDMIKSILAQREGK